MKVVSRFLVERSQADSAAARALARSDRPVELVDEPPRTGDYRQGKRRLVVTGKWGDAFDVCASKDDRYACCAMHVLRAVSNCPFDCSYCFLQNYLTDSTTRVVGDVDALIDEVRREIARQPWRFFRVGSWELGDSLALEPLTGTAAQLVRGFAGLPNAMLELRTKADWACSLDGIAHGGRTAVGWTLSPAAVVTSEELRTAPLARRLDAMSTAARHGYLVSAHLDPMVLHDGWEAAYEALVDAVFEAVPADRVAFVSLGSLRFNPEMKRKLEENFPRSRISAAEMVLGDDGKVRYVKPNRLALYRAAYRAIRRRSSDVFVYLCMERWDVWERILGFRPRSTGHVDYLFARSLHRRFPGLVPVEPDEALYDPRG